MDKKEKDFEEELTDIEIDDFAVENLESLIELDNMPVLELEDTGETFLCINLVDELNQYFGMEVEDVQQFKEEFKDEYFPHTQSENLLNFLLHLERKSKE